MSITRRFVRWCVREWPTLLVIAIGALVQIYLVTRPFDALVNTILPDDALFYFQVARNIVHGLGSTFDGINPANGYHPLWMLILVPIYTWFNSTAIPDVEPIHFALLLQVVLNIGSALFISRILTRITESRWVRAFGMVIWVLDPFLLYQTVNGLETPLALFFFSFFFLVALRTEEGAPSRTYYWIGAIGGLMVLARLDMAFYLLAFLGWILLAQGRKGWANAFRTAIVAAVPVGAFLVWNYVNFHMLLTASSEAEALFAHVLTYQDNGSSWAVFAKSVVYFTQYEGNATLLDTSMFALASAFFGALGVLVLRGDIALPRRIREIPVSLALFGGFVLLFIADASIRWVGRTWYFVSFDLFLVIVVCLVVDRLFPYVRYKRTAAVVLLCAVLFSFYVDWSKNLRGQNNEVFGQSELVTSALWMNANLPQGSLIGSFTPGVMGYVSTDHVVDLDGLINNNAYEAMKTRMLWQYIENEHIGYFAQTGDHLSYSFKSFLGIDDPYDYLKQITTASTTPGIELYQVKQSP